MTEYREYIKSTRNDHRKHKVYIFTFVANGKQRYYVGQTSNIDLEERARSHLRYKEKSILDSGKIKTINSDELVPISFEIVDSARSKNRARYLERKIYLELASKVEDVEMVCGGH